MRLKNLFGKQLKLWHWFLILLLTSVVISVVYNHLSMLNEQRNRLEFAKKLLKSDDANAVQIFEGWEQYARFDPSILCRNTDEDTKIERLRKLFDSAFFERYTVEFLFCDADEYLQLLDGTIVNCHEYFEERFRRQGRQTDNEIFPRKRGQLPFPV
jgi:hypothetical protein